MHQKHRGPLRENLRFTPWTPGTTFTPCTPLPGFHSPLPGLENAQINSSLGARELEFEAHPKDLQNETDGVWVWTTSLIWIQVPSQNVPGPSQAT